MTTAKPGERADLWQLRGFASNDIKDAFRSVHVIAAATQCEKPFFHVQVRNPDGEALAREQWERVADRIESKLGFSGQPRAISFHCDQNTGHEHMHVAWSRIDDETMTAKCLPFFKLRLKEACRELENELGLTQVKNERDGSVLAPNRNEFEQARRLGVDIHDVRDTIRECWEHSDCGRAFQLALGAKGLTLAKGQRRDYIVLDAEGGLHALGKRILGSTATEVRMRLSDLDPERLPAVDQAREQIATRADSRETTPHVVEVREEALPNATIEKEKIENEALVALERPAIDAAIRSELMIAEFAGAAKELVSDIAKCTEPSLNITGEAFEMAAQGVTGAIGGLATAMTANTVAASNRRRTSRNRSGQTGTARMTMIVRGPANDNKPGGWRNFSAQTRTQQTERPSE
jgi:hypothetical protein